jgi:multisubunit Na+/H+ antiporter MnhC subunit
VRHLTDAFVGLNLGAAACLFALGLFALASRESLLRIFLGLEVMGKGATLAIITAAMAVTAIAIEVVVIAVALAMAVRWHALKGSLAAPGTEAPQPQGD